MCAKMGIPILYLFFYGLSGLFGISFQTNPFKNNFAAIEISGSLAENCRAYEITGQAIS
jgi:hypothetical protein